MFRSREWLVVTAVLLYCTVKAYPQQASGDKFSVLTETISPLNTMRNLSNVGQEGRNLISVSPQAAAPQLSRELVYAVGSTQYSNSTGNFWEYMTQIGQTSTVGDHGGTQLRVVVQEIGYGGTPTIRINGSIMPKSVDYQDTSICIVGSNYVSPCPAGNTIVGYYRYINLDGYQSGTFSYQNSSLNSPYTTLSTSITIK